MPSGSTSDEGETISDTFAEHDSWYMNVIFWKWINGRVGLLGSLHKSWHVHNYFNGDETSLKPGDLITLIGGTDV
jgi:hypothetical protein